MPWQVVLRVMNKNKKRVKERYEGDNLERVVPEVLFEEVLFEQGSKLSEGERHRETRLELLGRTRAFSFNSFSVLSFLI